MQLVMTTHKIKTTTALNISRDIHRTPLLSLSFLTGFIELITLSATQSHIVNLQKITVVRDG